jgi:hypothetical protein
MYELTLRVFGSNLLLKDKKLEIEIRKPFEYIQRVATQLNDNKWLEPNFLPVISTQSAFLGANNNVLGG